MKKASIIILLIAVWTIYLSDEIRCQTPGAPSQEEFELYEKASQEKDLAAKQKLLLEAVQKHPKSTLDPNISYEYAKIYADLRAKGSWQQMADAAEKYLQHRPSDQISIAAASESYQKLGNPQKLVAFGTKLYSTAPSTGTAYFVAKAYQALEDGPNFLKWAERTLKHDPNNLEMLVEVTTVYWRMQNLPQAATSAQQILQALQTAKKPGELTVEQWSAKVNQVRAFAYGAIGEAAYAKNDVGGALKNLEAAVKANKRYDFAYYRLGFLYWKAGRIDEACMSFAKAFVLEGASSPDARNQLYNLYQTTRGNTKGVTPIIQQARESLK